MKNLFIILLLMVCGAATAQTPTKIFPDSVAYWRERSITGEYNHTEYSTTDYLMLGDTVINDTAYKNLYIISSKGNDPGSQHYGLTIKIAVVRKDSQRIFVRFGKGYSNGYFVGETDYVMADFSLQSGDTIFSKNAATGLNNYLIVKENGRNINTATNDTVFYKTFKGSKDDGYANSFLDSNLLITGMGFNSSFFFLMSSFDSTSVTNQGFFSGYRAITYFCSDGELIYQNDRFSSSSFDCSKIDTTTIYYGIKEVSKQQLRAYPNPASSFVNVEGFKGQIQKVVITNMLGQSFLPQYFESSGSITLDVQTLLQGVYWAKVETDKTTYLCKIIKQ